MALWKAILEIAIGLWLRIRPKVSLTLWGEHRRRRKKGERNFCPARITRSLFDCMNISFSKHTQEGDTVVVSLCSLYEDLSSIFGDDYLNVELVNIDIVRESGKGVFPIQAMADICRTIAKIMDDSPNTIAYYFCDFATEIPNIKNTATIFSACFSRDSLRIRGMNGVTKRL